MFIRLRNSSPLSHGQKGAPPETITKKKAYSFCIILPCKSGTAPDLQGYGFPSNYFTPLQVKDSPGLAEVWVS